MVCFPLPREADTSPVLSDSDASILFKSVLLPAPVCPQRATTELANSFFIFDTLVLTYIFIFF
ncbi:MAG: hypothetical protein L6V81_11500 [Clostridium sp.]|nr:MAG: hypothetical protein L6V81_11500 [Clostridium sp.]